MPGRTPVFGSSPMWGLQAGNGISESIAKAGDTSLDTVDGNRASAKILPRIRPSHHPHLSSDSLLSTVIMSSCWLRVIL